MMRRSEGAAVAFAIAAGSVLTGCSTPPAGEQPQSNYERMRELDVELARIEGKKQANERDIFDSHMALLRLGWDPGPLEILLQIGLPYRPYVELYAEERRALLAEGKLKPMGGE